MSEKTRTESTNTHPHADIEQRLRQLRAEIAEINRDLTDEQQDALAERWAVVVRTRLAEHVLAARRLQDVWQAGP